MAAASEGEAERSEMAYWNGVEQRRARILDAMVVLSAEQGFAGVTVEAVCVRAHVSRGSFYEQFESLEDCFLAVMDDGLRYAGRLISEAFEQVTRSDREPLAVALAGLRGAIAALLCLFEERPELARVWLIEAQAAGAWAMRRRERNVARLTDQILAHWGASAAVGPHPLTAPGVMASVLGLVQRHLISEPDEPLIGLMGALMAVVSTPYLDADEVRAEMRRAEALAQRLREQARPVAAGDPQLPAAVANPHAHRARACLAYLLRHPGASNSQVAAALAINSRTQTSTLLRRLRQAGLLHQLRARPGHANAWMLTHRGRRAAELIGADVANKHRI